MPYDAYVESSESPVNPAPGPESIDLPGGTVESQIAALQTQLASMPKHDMGRWKVLDALEGLYSKVPGDQEPPDQPQEPQEKEGDETNQPPMDLESAANEVGQTIDALEREWGSSFGANLQVAQSAVSALSQELGTDVAAIIDEAGIGNSLAVLKTFYELGKGGSAPAISQNEAAHLIQALQQTEAYRKAGPAHDLITNVIADLYDICYYQ